MILTLGALVSNGRHGCVGRSPRWSRLPCSRRRHLLARGRLRRVGDRAVLVLVVPGWPSRSAAGRCGAGQAALLGWSGSRDDDRLRLARHQRPVGVAQGRAGNRVHVEPRQPQGAAANRADRRSVAGRQLSPPVRLAGSPGTDLRADRPGHAGRGRSAAPSSCCAGGRTRGRLVGGNGGRLGGLTAYGTTWVDAKVLMITSPVIMLLAWAGVAGLWRSGSGGARSPDSGSASSSPRGSPLGRDPVPRLGPRADGALRRVGGAERPLRRPRADAVLPFDEWSLYELRDMDVGGPDFVYPPGQPGQCRQGARRHRQSRPRGAGRVQPGTR